MNREDRQSCIETWRELQEPCDCGSYPDCDCNNSEIVMLSNGYAEVYQDGDVVQFGTTIANVSDEDPDNCDPEPATPNPAIVLDHNGKPARYTSVGCYPIFGVTADGGCLCPKCIEENFERCNGGDPSCPDDDQWRIVASDCNWEDPSLYCDNCNERIESAYAEPDAD